METEQEEKREEMAENVPNGDTEAKKVGSVRAWTRVVDVISFNGIVKNMPYLIFLTLLAIVYIANNNHAIALVREISIKKNELKELKWQYMDVQSRLMFQTSESQLRFKTEKLGLKLLKEPAFEIKIKPTTE